MSYNGCTNWETWHFKLYFLNDMSEEETADEYEGMTEDEIADTLREKIEAESRETNASGIMKEFITMSIDEINFTELAEDIHEVCERIKAEQEREEAEEEERNACEANKYRLMRERQQKQYNEWTPGKVFFAFNNKQFEEGMQSIGLTASDTDKIYSIGVNGGFILNTANKEYWELLEGFDREQKEAIEADTTGEGFIYEMFYYELGNHEYCYSYDLQPTLDAIGITIEEVNANPQLLHGLRKAKQEYAQWAQKFA